MAHEVAVPKPGPKQDEPITESKITNNTGSLLDTPEGLENAVPAMTLALRQALDENIIKYLTPEGNNWQVRPKVQTLFPTNPPSANPVRHARLHANHTPSFFAALTRALSSVANFSPRRSASSR